MTRASRLFALLLVAACTAKRSEGSAADTSSVSMPAVDSLSAVQPAAAPAPPTSPAAPDSSVATKSPPSPGIIGYDSAFGPKFIIDSTGKLVPIKPKRP